MPRITQVLNPGFLKANSDNLPKVDPFMLACFFNSTSFLNPETRNVKTLRSCRASYGDSAIGHVQLKRCNNQCEVQAKITPEHRLRSESYIVRCIIDEKEEEIIFAKCESCKAKEDGCKHAIAFIAWLQRRSEEPSVTSVTCYWKKSSLSTVGTSPNHVTMDNIHAQINIPPPSDAEDFFNRANVFLKEKAKTVSLVKQTSITKSYSLHHLMLDFKEDLDDSNHSGKLFLKYCSTIMKNSECEKLAEKTNAQKDSPLWFNLRFARVSASRLFDVSRCKTPDGALVNTIMGVTKVKETAAMVRGQMLEGEVLREVKKQYAVKIKKTGLVMKPSEPIFGASPDGLFGDNIIEVKCPSKEKTFQTYFTKDLRQPADKYNGQMHLQMHLCNKGKGLFCVAYPDFETSKKVKIIEVNFNKAFCDDLMNKAREFWIKSIYPVLYNGF